MPSIISSSCLNLPTSSTVLKAAPRFSLHALSPRSWAVSFARTSILAVLDNAITIGHLTISDSEGTHYYGTYQKGCNDVQLNVINDTFWLRILLSGDLGFSEAYMIGDVEVSSLKGAMNLWLENESGMANTLSSTVAKVSSAMSGLYNSFLGQTRSQARLNAIASYDQSNELFKAFLSKEMMYSCALWSEAEGGVRGDLEVGPTPGDLEAAQRRKIHHVLRAARVKTGHRILEFGSGWGGLAIEAARSFGCEVDTLTLSKEQKSLAEERIKEAGLEGRIRVHLLDYREIPAEFEKAFDAFVSVEMLEHVGAKHYNTYFKLVDFALKSKDATIVVTSSTFPESRFSSYQAEDFMRKYMWPNSCLPSATALITAAQAGSQSRFTLEGVENHAAHYPRTLREWGRRLEANLTQELIIKDYPALQDVHEYAAFKRKWEYLFAYAGAGFAKGYITCHMLTFIRQNDTPVRCD
ncbi:cyclopropane-fatty-acyl-phospholipid synthase [Laccaria bicolor S238N-H82]|uniref:Cyclopropane-fatty-acyl-phospholipid synthase n=1 Tax=Laccaria bicolor (strain S238N-H82 / ATCC MYA-4686) TaxID=486041 RepID=B0DC09_LACBS|nr:cyclopropane-fatty-acyl-phospholipid synthase [Laccaria bicolor S238N-H82]EDR07813.1 cyclopropane-fatty-acyl-phospholipid synthase [Laccaria bicolor S238N-H82]|eukprot:XP_001881602.1 cyclopropane-fatty-acyl-phospholipid synthase [Laccaria bicolor S238N-H82]